jgi:ketosteroid isomerase-like protein
VTDPMADAEIRRTIAEYCQTVDDGRFSDCGRCFAEDAVVRVMGMEVIGRQEIEAWIASAQPPERRGRHVTTNSVICVDGRRAEATSDFLFLATGEDGPHISTAGRYVDTFVAAEGRWVFASREIQLWP